MNTVYTRTMMSLHGRSNRWTFDWVPWPPIFVTTCVCGGGGHLDEQIQGAASPANAKAAIEKQVNEFHLERMNSPGKVNSLVCWAEASRPYPIVAQVAHQYLCMPISSTSSERSFNKTGHMVRASVVYWKS